MSESISSEMKDALKVAYEEVCKAHDGITDFRAKLLALLPIASGTGVLLLLSDHLDKVMPHLAAIGVFGFMITLGLFLYELRGVQKCYVLIKCGSLIEQKLLTECQNAGAFSTNPKPALKGLVGATWAALIIYPTIIGTWSYVGCLGLSFTPRIALIVATAIAVLFIVTGKIVSETCGAGPLAERGNQIQSSQGVPSK
jgi:hypothetical protein